MIRFDVNEKGYSVEWTNLPYDMLYMVYYPIGRSKKIVGGRIVFQPEKQVPEFVVCPNQYGARTGVHSQHSPKGAYSIRLCTNSLGENCEIFAEKTVYLGHKVTVKYGLSGTVGKNDPVARFEVWSDCHIPREHIWLAYKAGTGDGADGTRPRGRSPRRGRRWASSRRSSSRRRSRARRRASSPPRRRCRRRACRRGRSSTSRARPSGARRPRSRRATTGFARRRGRDGPSRSTS